MRVNPLSLERAYSNTKAAVIAGSLLPDQVFSGQWDRFRFSTWDFLLDLETVNIVKALMRAEGSTSCSMVNVSEELRDPNKRAVFFFDQTTEAQDYTSKLVSGGGGAWLYGIDTFVCSSDLGQWAIYCQKNSDMTILAVREAQDLLVKYSEILDVLLAAEVTALIANPPLPVPFGTLLDTWKHGLIKNYADAV